jgi:hypothetical protein
LSQLFLDPHQSVLELDNVVHQQLGVVDSFPMVAVVALAAVSLAIGALGTFAATADLANATLIARRIVGRPRVRCRLESFTT